eukprot:COSAG06_NODE_990_length_11174_cov_17.540135_3_plen_73_part_00
MALICGPAVQLVRVGVMLVLVARVAVNQAALTVGDHAGAGRIPIPIAQVVEVTVDTMRVGLCVFAQGSPTSV